MLVEKLTNQNINDLKNIYNEFTKVAVQDFLFEVSPLSFEDFKANFQEGFIKSYFSKDNKINGFLLYSDNLTESLEITLIYAQDNDNNIKKQLFEKFLTDAKENYKNKTISYPMLGIQNSFAKGIENFGFSIVGQVILERNLQNITQIPRKTPYSTASWNDAYMDSAIKIINKEFSDKSDAKFDVRFKTIDGCKNVLECIVNGFYGEFFAEETSVLLYENQPVGFCFVNLASQNTANIPLLVIDKSHQGKNFGELLIKTSIKKLQNKNIKLINTTTDPQNAGAMKSYFKAGFSEKYSYKHAYMQI